MSYTINGIALLDELETWLPDAVETWSSLIRSTFVLCRRDCDCLNSKAFRMSSTAPPVVSQPITSSIKSRVGENFLEKLRNSSWDLFLQPFVPAATDSCVCLLAVMFPQKLCSVMGCSTNGTSISTSALFHPTITVFSCDDWSCSIFCASSFYKWHANDMEWMRKTNNNRTTNGITFNLNACP